MSGLRRSRAERGITIIEMTVVLSVLFILAGALTPIISESVDTARTVKAANDARLIAAGVVQFQKDLGPAVIVRRSSASALQAARGGADAGVPEVMVSDGNNPVVDGEETASLSLGERLGLMAVGHAAPRASRAARRKWLEAARGLIEDHLITNRAGYGLKRPAEGEGGWNGPYLSKAVKADPWGNRYQINTVGLDGGITAVDVDGNPRRAVFVVSAGGNGVIETPFDQPISDARLFGDDVGIRIQ